MGSHGMGLVGIKGQDFSASTIIRDNLSQSPSRIQDSWKSVSVWDFCQPLFLPDIIIDKKFFRIKNDMSKDLQLYKSE